MSIFLLLRHTFGRHLAFPSPFNPFNPFFDLPLGSQSPFASFKKVVLYLWYGQGNSGHFGWLVAAQLNSLMLEKKEGKRLCPLGDSSHVYVQPSKATRYFSWCLASEETSGQTSAATIQNFKGEKNQNKKMVCNLKTSWYVRYFSDQVSYLTSKQLWKVMQGALLTKSWHEASTLVKKVLSA